MNKFKIILLIPTAILAILLSGCKKGNADNTNKIKETDWVVTQAATCTQDGVETKTDFNGKKEKRIIHATGHKIVEDEAIEATCTSDGLTAGTHCDTCGEVIAKQEIVPAHHTLVTNSGVAPTCTRAGRSSSKVCSVCGAEVEEEVKVRPLAHNYVNGYCTRCHIQKPDCVELNFADFSEGSPTNFITSKAYPGGSTVRFSAFVPEGIPEKTWWGIAWSTNPSTANIYDCAGGKSAKPLMNISVKGKWATYSVTLPDDGNSYYIYLGGPAGHDNWNGKTIMVDDFVIKDASGKVLASEGFDNGYENSIFKVTDSSMGVAVSNAISCQGGHKVATIKGVVATCIEDGLTEGKYCEKCGKTIVAQTVIHSKGGHEYNENFICKKCGKPYENVAAKIHINQLNESGESNFITNKAYPGGSTVKMRVKAPSEAAWWGFAWTTDKSDTDVYNAADSTFKKGKPILNSTDEWQNVTFTLPNDKNKYYIYVGGPREVESVLIDDFEICDTNGKLIDSCDFDNGVLNSIFDVTEFAPDGKTKIVENYIWEQGHTIVVDPAINPTCISAGKTEGKICSVCGKVISESKVIPALREDKGHEYVDGKCIHCHHIYENRAVAIYTKNIIEEKNVNFITEKKYKGGTTVTFDAYVPVGTTWWGMAWTTDPSKASVYEPAYGKVGVSLNNAANNGKWATYSVTLPNDDNEYYIYFGASVGEVGDKPFLLDNFVFTKGTQTLDTCYFDDGIDTKDVTSIFNITASGTNDKIAVKSEAHDFYSPCKKSHTLVDIPAVEATCTTKGTTAGKKCSVCGEIIVQPTEVNYISGDGKHHYDEKGECIYCHLPKENKSVAIYTKNLVEESFANFISTKKYTGGTTVTFDAYIPSGTTWWGIAFTTDKANVSIYNAAYNNALGVMLLDSQKVGKWASYTVTLPNDGKEYYFYFGAPVGEIGDNPILLDNFVIKNGNGDILDQCDFDNGINDSTVTDVFTVNTSGLNSTIAAGEVSHDYYNPCKNGHTLVDIPATEATCTTKGTTVGKKCSVCGEIITQPTETNYLSPDGKHHYEDGECIYCHGKEIFVTSDMALAIEIKNLSTDKADIISSETYKGGTTITFDAYVPTAKSGVTNSWWGIAWSTSSNVSGINGASKPSNGVSLYSTSKLNKWATYTVKLPDDGNDYYFYIIGPSGNKAWNNGKKVYIDNIKITDSNGTVLSESDFNVNLDSNGIFTINGSDNVVTLVEHDSAEN